MSTSWQHAEQWQFDESRSILAHRSSGQCVRVEGPMQNMRGLIGTDVPNDEWLRFTYMDREVQYPLLLRHGILDYSASAALWRRETNAAESSLPPYGLWLRVDEAAQDALIRWRDLEEPGDGPSRITTVGGWINSSWTTDTRRHRYKTSNDLVLIGSDNAEPVSSLLVPLDAEPPAPWEFVDPSRIVPPVRLRDIRPDAAGFYYLSPDSPLTGFEDRMPHLRRTDRSAVMFPSRLTHPKDSFRHVRDEIHYYPRVYWIYADQDGFLELMADWDELHGDSVSFVVNPVSKVGWRTIEGANQFRLIPARNDPDTRLPAKEMLATSPALWRELSRTLVEGCLKWTGAKSRLQHSRHHLEELQSRGGEPWQSNPEVVGVELGALRRISVSGGYFACDATNFPLKKIHLPKGYVDPFLAALEASNAKLKRLTDGPKPLPLVWRIVGITVIAIVLLMIQLKS